MAGPGQRPGAGVHRAQDHRHPARLAQPVLGQLDAAIGRLRTETSQARIVRIAIVGSYLDRIGGCREPLWRAVRHGREGGAVTSAIEALFLLGNDAYFTGRWGDVQALTDEGLEQALGVPGADRWPFDLARIQLAYGERLRRAQSPSEARTHLSAAIDAFERLGARPWAARAGNELRATGIHRERRVSPDASLTAQQLQIAQLAAAGLSNKQIAERLFLSPRTVGYHLHQVFPKLGVTSRAALRDALAARAEGGDDPALRD